jgi:hypothetical protein
MQSVKFNQITRREELSTTFYGIFKEDDGVDEHTYRQKERTLGGNPA